MYPYGYPYPYPYIAPYYVPMYGCGTTGVKFNLQLIDDAEKELTKKGVVYVDGDKDVAGTVDQFDGFFNGAIQLEPGEHDIIVRLKDGRESISTVNVRECQVVHIPLQFPALQKQAPKLPREGVQQPTTPQPSATTTRQEQGRSVQQMEEELRQHDLRIQELESAIEKAGAAEKPADKK